MKDIDTLKRYLLQAQPDLSTARIDLLSRLLHGLLICRSVNLMKIATAMPGPTQKMSRYRRLQRFFSSSVSPQVLSPLIVRRLLPKNQPAVLTATMDRTHWVFGQTEENLLCLGLEFAGVSIPLESMSLGKAGNNNTEERKAIFAQV